MAQQTYSITRTRESFKPRVDGADLPFFSDGDGNMLIGVGGERATELTGSGSTTVRHLPYMHLNGDANDAALPVLPENKLPEGVELNYRIDGGFNNNCIVVTWSDAPGRRVQWVALKTFTGMQLKYPMPRKLSKCIFALAAEDAFAYCNKEPCEECGFRCKSGFCLYVCVEGTGVVRKPVERISMLGIIGDGGLEAGTTDHRS